MSACEGTSSTILVDEATYEASKDKIPYNDAETKTIKVKGFGEVSQLLTYF